MWKSILDLVIDLHEIGFFDDTVYPFDMGDEDSYPLLEFEPDECLICGQITTHGTPWCPYKEFVPHDASLPPGIQRVCRCCGKRDGHPGEDWEACAILKRCTDCGTLGEHWNGDSDCPTKTGKPRCTEETEEEKPDSYKQTGRIFLFLDEDED
ncbi:uncharacterized protein LOC133745760 isoform X2 [Rosa rugosa]|uniref:uncharacterized protein LOC133745760 isoform X2 n=1 Tax=Rosa rugosa TaxID=74645 RepID=UPI002B40452B|nr:uncharacterized protein LOC133745760 isoform X2 [Rosa rugosa]